MKCLASDDSRAHPKKRFAGVGCVWVFGVLYVEVSAEFAGGGLHPLVLVLPAGSAKTAIHGLIGPSM
jgi:hypothetical protein